REGSYAVSLFSSALSSLIQTVAGSCTTTRADRGPFFPRCSRGKCPLRLRPRPPEFRQPKHLSRFNPKIQIKRKRMRRNKRELSLTIAHLMYHFIFLMEFKLVHFFNGI